MMFDFSRELLKWYKSNPAFFEAQVALLLQHAIEKEKQNESVQVLLASGVRPNPGYGCMPAILKEAGVRSIEVEVPAHVLSLKKQRPDSVCAISAS